MTCVTSFIGTTAVRRKEIKATWKYSSTFYSKLQKAKEKKLTFKCGKFKSSKTYYISINETRIEDPYRVSCLNKHGKTVSYIYCIATKNDTLFSLFAIATKDEFVLGSGLLDSRTFLEKRHVEAQRFPTTFLREDFTVTQEARARLVWTYYHTAILRKESFFSTIWTTWSTVTYVRHASNR